MLFKRSYFLLFHLLFFSLANCQDQVAYYPANKAFEQLPPINYINESTSLRQDRFNRSDEAYYFNGKDSRITINTPSYLPLKGNFSISFWLKSKTQQRAQAFSSGDGNGNFDFDIHPTSGIWAYWNGGGDPGIYDSITVTDNYWHSVVMTRKDETVKLYIDGRFIKDFVYKGVIGSTSDLILGGRSEFPFEGYLDDINFYKESLTENEIRNIFTENPFFIYPNSNSVLTTNNYYDILLRASNGRQLALELSYNNGFSWQLISPDLVARDTLFRWKANAIPRTSRECRLRLKDASGKLVALSDKFTIQQPVTTTAYKWTKVTANAPFKPRDGAGATVFHNRVWLMGGWNPNIFPSATTNELWVSKDGVSWDSAGLAAWEGRHVSGWIAFKNKMWLVGGDANQQRYQTDIWNSDDGYNWNQVLDQLPWAPRASHMVTTFNNKIWMTGGQEFPNENSESDSLFNDIWNSDDGINWNLVTPNAPWEGRGFGGFVSFRGKLWIIGGGRYNFPREYYNDVWSSTDGINWIKHPPAPWRPRFFHQTIVFDNKIWVIGGYGDNSGNLGDVWYTSNGITWTEAENVPWPPRHAATAFVLDNNLFVAAGTVGNHPDSLANDVWKLTPYLDVRLSSNDDVIVPFGQSHLLQTTDNRNFVYEWLKNDTPMPGHRDSYLNVVEEGLYTLVVQEKTTGIKGKSVEINVLFEPNTALNVKNDTLIHDETIMLEAHYDSTYKYKWFYNNKKIPQENAYRLLAKFDGDYFVEITAGNGLVKQSDALHITFDRELTATGKPNLLLENRNDEYLNVYYYNKGSTGLVGLKIFDINGREYLSQMGDKINNVIYFAVKIDHFSAGLFVAMVETFTDRRSRKFIKQK